MLCARVMRGINSTEKEVTPVAASCLRRFEGAKRTMEANDRLIAAEKARDRLCR